ncbi:tail fiber domain-containing protein [Arthrobacter sp. Z1-15]
MSYPYEQIFAGDPSAPERVAANGIVTIFAPGDAAMTPITITTLDGLPLPNPVQVNESGFGPAFQHATLDQVAWAGGGFTGILTSYKGMKEVAVAAGVSASAAAAAAQMAAENSTAPTAEAVEREIVTEGTAANTAVSEVASTAAHAAAATKLGKEEAVSTYTPLESFKEWSGPLASDGGGIGGVKVGKGAAGQISDGSTGSEAQSFIAIGRDALGKASRARGCIAIGAGSLAFGNPGVENLAIGVFALSNVTGKSEWYGDTEGTRNVGIGSLAGHFISSGAMNTLVGRDAGHSITTGTHNVALGYRALSTGNAPIGLSGRIENQYPVTAFRNVAVGTQALTNAQGSNNTAIGDRAAMNAKASNQAVYVGAGAGMNLGVNISENNKVLTYPNVAGTYAQAGTTITVTAPGAGVIGGNKVMVRFMSGILAAVTSSQSQWLTAATTADGQGVFTVTAPAALASGNVLIDVVETAATAVLGGANTIVGFNALGNATNNGGNTTAVGEQAGLNSLGQQNTFVGSRSGFNLTTGSANTFIGYNAGRANITGGGLAAESSVTAIGAGSGATGSNQVQLGGASDTTYVYGTVQNRSDARDKADIRDTVLGLDFIERLRPVDYRWDMREDYFEEDSEGNRVPAEKDGSKKRSRFHHGFIAQEVQQVIEETGEDFGGLQDHSINGGSDVLSIGYDEVIAPLVKAMQELTARVKELEGQVK